MNKFKVDVKCPACKGTGLYVGMAERDGFAVVCYKCKGTGCYYFEYEYEEFGRREESHDIQRVLETNPGIMLGKNLDFGGMPYKEWVQGLPFPEKSEMRNYTCPRWWYKCINSHLMPSWKNCAFGISGFSNCPEFKNKQKCWNKFDEEKK